MRVAILILNLLCCFYVKADQNKLALKALEKGDYPDVIAHLQKSLDKEPVNPGAYFIYAQLYTSQDFDQYSLDTAYIFIQRALMDYHQSEEKTLKDLEKNLIFLVDIESKKAAIQDLAFERAKDLNSIRDYNYFVGYYKESKHVAKAILLRNRIIYDKVAKKNTWQTYKNFIEQFPDAEQVPEAQKAYERLLYIDYTDDGKLRSLENFVENHPDNEHRNETEYQILKIRGGLNRPVDFLNFKKKYPQSPWNRELMKRFFHIDKDFHDLKYLDDYASDKATKDSLLRVVDLGSRSLIPVYEDDKYGFISLQGDEVLAPRFDYIKEEYLCGNIRSDVLEVMVDRKLQLVNYLGEAVYLGGFDATEDLSGGFVKMRKNGRFGVWHKSGLNILAARFDDVQLLASNLLKVELDDRWGLYSAFGEELFTPQFEAIYLINDYWIFQKNDLLAVTKLDRLKPLTDGNPVELDFKFDELELVKDRYLLCFSGDHESLINEELEVVIEASDHTIIPMLDNWMVKNDNGYSYYHEENGSFLRETFDDISFSKNWFAFKRDTTWTLLSEGFGFEPRFQLDSARVLTENMVYFQRADTARLAFFPNRLVEIKEGDVIKILGIPNEEDSSQYLMIENETNKRIYSERGEFQFNSKYDEVEYLSNDFFSYEWRGKKGILNRNGRIMLKAEFDGIGQVTDSIAPILLKGKFGYYDIGEDQLLEPQYLKKIEDYSQQYQVALSEEGYGFLSMDGDEISELIFNKIDYWNDSVALVQKENSWMLYAIDDEEALLENIQKVEYLLNSDDEKIAYILTDQGFGIFSNKEGVILSPSFNHIVNLGTPREPLYFAEKHVPEADFYVVVYANAKGETIRSNAYRVEEYEKILCEN